jgi:hypothetical protein
VTRRRVRADRSIQFEPCLTRLAKPQPAGAGWIHEIKHDGFRIIAQYDAAGVRLFTRKGFDSADRFIRAASAVATLRSLTGPCWNDFNLPMSSLRRAINLIVALTLVALGAGGLVYFTLLIRFGPVGL